MPGERLRILHLAHVRWFNAEVQYALDLAVEMMRQGHRPVLWTQTGSPGARNARGAGVETVEDAGLNAKGAAAVLGAIRATVRLGRLLAADRFDLVEVHRPEGFPLVVWACRRAGVPVVRVRGDMRPVRTDPLNRWVYTRGVRAVVAANTAIAADLERRLGPAVRVVTIFGGVDPDRFTPDGPAADVRGELGFPAGAFLAGILGRLGEVKGHDSFLAAARRVLDTVPDARFVVLAKEPTPRQDELLGRVEADPVLRGRVGFLGRRDDLPAVLRAFDLGVVASTGSEANCRVGLEWMASGVPLVATRVGVLPDLVDDGRTGLLVPPGDPSALGEKIVYCAERPARTREMGRAARLRVLDRFTLDRCARLHADLAHTPPPGSRP